MFFHKRRFSDRVRCGNGTSEIIVHAVIYITAYININIPTIDFSLPWAKWQATTSELVAVELTHNLDFGAVFDQGYI